MRAVGVLAALGAALAFGAVAGSAAPPPIPTFAPATYYKSAGDAGAEPTSLAVGDLNGDGKPELAITKTFANVVSVLVNKGDGTFPVRRSYRTGRDPRAVAIGDLDGDGHPELVTANHGGTGYVSVLPGRGDGTFDEEARADYPGGGYALGIGELNGDGHPDLVTTSAGEGNSRNRVVVLLNRGDGTFLPAVNYPAGAWPGSAVVADLNGDGNADVAVANNLGKSVSVLLNRGNGELEPRVNYRTGGLPDSIVSGDLNADGKPDLVTTNGGPWTVSVLLNRGEGTFAAKRDYDVDGEVGLAIGDLNGDGSPDLAISNPTNEGSLVFALFNRGDGRFGVRDWLEYGVKNPYAVAIADLDGDGRNDLATTSVQPGKYPAVVRLNKPGVCNVQFAVDIPLWNAKIWIERGGCRVGKVRRVYSKLPAGRVLRQTPRFGVVVPRGTKVDLVVTSNRKR